SRRDLAIPPPSAKVAPCRPPSLPGSPAQRCQRHCGGNHLPLSCASFDCVQEDPLQPRYRAHRLSVPQSRKNRLRRPTCRTRAPPFASALRTIRVRATLTPMASCRWLRELAVLRGHLLFQVCELVRRGRPGSDRSAFVSSFSAAEALHLRL